MTVARNFSNTEVALICLAGRKHLAALAKITGRPATTIQSVLASHEGQALVLSSASTRKQVICVCGLLGLKTKCREE